MIIGIDGRSLVSAKTGIGMYTDRLLREFSGWSELVTKVYLPIPFLNPQKKGQAIDRVAHDYPGCEIKSQAFPPPKIQRWIWGKFDVPAIESIIGEVDLYHATSFIMPPMRKAKGVVTLYDLTFKIFPEYHTPGMQAFTRDLPRYVSRSDCIIAISEHTKRDVMEHLAVPEDRIRVTLLAAGENCRVIDDAASIQKVLQKYGIDREYILYTGTLEPRKNIATLIRAYHALRRESGVPHRLVLAGKKGWLYDDIFATIQELGLMEDVLFTGYVPEDDLPYLYNGASLFAYPSKYEGFGLPPLEAMACGCPVVSSNSSSLPEVVGDAGLMVAPEQTNDLAEAMLKVLSDSSLRDLMRCRGLERAAMFSWKRCARETLDVYRYVTGMRA